MWSLALNTDLARLQFLVVDALEDVKAQNIQVFDTTPMTTLFDRVVVASGTSNRQTRALAKSVYDKVRGTGAPVLSIEGTDTGEWVLVDLGDVVVHIMQPVTRDHYRLEDIWGEVSVSLEEITKPFRKKVAAKRPPANTPATQKPATKKAPEKKLATGAPATRKPRAKKAAAKTEAARQPAVKKPITENPSASKAVAKRPAAKKPAAKKKATPK